MAAPFDPHSLKGDIRAWCSRRLFTFAHFQKSTYFCRGCAEQTCEAYSLSRCIAYRCFISSMDLPTGGPVLLKVHAQREQAQPQKRSCSTHTISRCLAKGHFRHDSIYNRARSMPSQASARAV